MNNRRQLLKWTSAAALPAAAATLLSERTARADEAHEKDILGSWNTKHDLPLPPGYFREFLSFAEGGVLHESNTLLYATSRFNFAAVGLPNAAPWNAINAADGLGSWRRRAKGVVDLVFRKFLFDGNSGQNFGDLLVSGTYSADGDNFSGVGHVRVVDPLTDAVMVDLGLFGSHGVRIG